MLFRGDARRLEPGPARLLTLADLPAMQALADVGQAMVFSPESLVRGIFYGVEVDGALVAMGGVQTVLPGFAELGSIVTHPDHLRRGYASYVTSALVSAMSLARVKRAFLCLFQTNNPARRLYEKLGFEVINELRLVARGRLVKKIIIRNERRAGE